MFSSQSGLFLQCGCALARTLAGTGIGAGALATHRQATTVTETTVATNVHQALDVHRGFAAQVTFDGELTNLVANFLQIGVGQVLHLFGVFNAACLANLAGAGATDTKNGSQANFSMFVRRNVDASDTCHFRPL
jgi:hypothetical protein